MILGDNIFYGGGLSGFLKLGVDNANENKATIFGYYVNDPERFGIMEFDKEMDILSVEEKPANLKTIDSSKANKELGWEPTTMFSDGIKLTIQWYKDHMDCMNEWSIGEYMKYYEEMYINRYEEK